MGMMDQAKMLMRAKKVQGELKKTEIEAVGAEGKVVVVFNGELKLQKLTIDDELLSPDRKGEHERVLHDAITQAMSKAQADAAEDTRDVVRDL